MALKTEVPATAWSQHEQPQQVSPPICRLSPHTSRLTPQWSRVTPHASRMRSTPHSAHLAPHPTAYAHDHHGAHLSLRLPPTALSLNRRPYTRGHRHATHRSPLASGPPLPASSLNPGEAVLGPRPLLSSTPLFPHAQQGYNPSPCCAKNAYHTSVWFETHRETSPVNIRPPPAWNLAQAIMPSCPTASIMKKLSGLGFVSAVNPQGGY